MSKPAEESPLRAVYEKRYIVASLTIDRCDDLLNRTNLRTKIDTDPYVVVFNDKGNVILRTAVLKNTLHPAFDAQSSTVTFKLLTTSFIIIQVWHRFVCKTVLNRKGEDAFLGEVKLYANQIQPSCDTGSPWLPGRRRSSAQSQEGAPSTPRDEHGRRTMTFFLEARTKEPDPKIRSLEHTKALGTITLAAGEVAEDAPDLIGVPTAMDFARHRPVRLDGTLRITGGRNLLKRDDGPGELSDPYCVVYFPDRNHPIYRSDTARCTLNPVFHVGEEIEMDRSAEGRLIVDVWNENPKPMIDNFLGCVEMRASEFPSDTSDRILELPLAPRADEHDAIIAKLRGRLGHLTAQWTSIAQTKRGGPSAAPANANANAPASAHASDVRHIMPLNPALLASLRPEAALPEARSMHFTATDYLRHGMVPPPGTPGYTDYVDPWGSRPPTAQRPPSASQSFHNVAMPPASALHPLPARPLPGETATTAPVLMTSVVPVTLADDHGRETSLFMDVDCPTLQPLLEAAQSALQVHPASALLLYGGEILHPLLSLRDNGALMLRGEGAIRIVVRVLKGRRRNVVLRLPGGAVTPLSIDTEWTIGDLKAMLCARTGPNGPLVPFAPADIDIVWRYNRLKDNMTIDYCHLPQNAPLQVVSKRSRVLDRIQAEHAAEGAHEPFYEEDLVGIPRRHTALELRRAKRLGQSLGGDTQPSERHRPSQRAPHTQPSRAGSAHAYRDNMQYTHRATNSSTKREAPPPSRGPRLVYGRADAGAPNTVQQPLRSSYAAATNEYQRSASATAGPRSGRAGRAAQRYRGPIYNAPAPPMGAEPLGMPAPQPSRYQSGQRRPRHVGLYEAAPLSADDADRGAMLHQLTHIDESLAAAEAAYSSHARGAATPAAYEHRLEREMDTLADRRAAAEERIRELENTESRLQGIARQLLSPAASHFRR